MEYLVSLFTFGVIWAILVLSLNVVVGYAGQVSLGHAAFFGIGAYAAAILSVRHDWPYLAVVAGAIVATALCGMLLGLPSLRVRHDFLVLASIGLNFIVVGVFAYVDYFGAGLGIVGIPLPQIAGWTITGVWFLGLCVVSLAAVAWLSWLLQRRWAGLAFVTVREDELAAAAVGVSHARYKIVAFGISGAIAGLGGALYAPFVGNVFPDRFGFIESIVLMAMLVFGGMGTVRGAIFGGLVLKTLPEYLRFGGEFRFAFYGAILLGVILLQPQGLLGDDSWLWRRLRHVTARLRTRRADRQQPWEAEEAPAEVPPPDPATPPALEVRGVTVDFDGLRALERVSLAVRPGEILGLIGPNGAGKTTLFNAIAGMVHLTEGEVMFEGAPIHGLPAHAIARVGVGRTFQIVRPFRALSVEQNVLTGLGVGVYPRLASLVRGWRQSLPAAWDITAKVGLAREAGAPSGQLPIGRLRQLEIGRVLGTGASVVLLDEPAAGLTSEELEPVGALIRRLAAEDRAVVLVEHNMRFAMRLCHRMVVLAGGRIIAEGSPEEVRHDPTVIEAYLGAEA